MDPISLRVAARYSVTRRFLASGLEVGRSFQNEKIRVHRYRDQLRVWDITNAGKRGKKVPELTVLLTRNYEGDPDDWFKRQTAELIETYSKRPDPYGAFKALLRDLQVDFPEDINLHEEQLRGVDVEPYGEIFEFNIPLDNKSSLRVEASPNSFLVVNHAWVTREGTDKGFFHDTSYRPVKVTDARAFYAWLKDNASKLKSFDNMDEFRDLWKTLNVQYDYH